MGQAILNQFEADHGIAEEQLEKLTYIPLDGEGTVDTRVNRWVIGAGFVVHPCD